MIKLYHGSNVRIDGIDLTLSRFGKDFGRGFYLNPNKRQAMTMAVRTMTRARIGVPTISTFMFDDTLLKKGSPLDVKIFRGYSVEWARFILANRNNLTNRSIHPYDIVVGPIVDDTVGLQISRFLQGYISIERMIEELRFHRHATQYFFGTEEAISYLTPLV